MSAFAGMTPRLAVRPGSLWSGDREPVAVVEYEDVYAEMAER